MVIIFLNCFAKVSKIALEVMEPAALMELETVLMLPLVLLLEVVE